MRTTRVIADLKVTDIDVARAFYAGFLGLSVGAFNLGWVARFETPDGQASIQLVARDATSPEDPVASVAVGDDIDNAYAEAQRRGYDIVQPLTHEAWGVRRFFVRDPDGNIINIVSHRDN